MITSFRNHLFTLLASLTVVLVPLTDALSAGVPKLTGGERAVEIDRKITILGNIAYGVELHTMTYPIGSKKIGEMMVRELAEIQGSINVGDDFLVNATSKDFDFADMTAWGTIDLESAKDLFGTSDDSEADEKKVKQRLTLGADILTELKAMGGISFGFTSGSSSYCGMSFMGLLIVDEENSTIYEIALTDSGPC